MNISHRYRNTPPEQLDDKSLSELMGRAVEIKKSHWGSDITYSRKVFIPLTNMCRDTCAYCTFVQHPDSPKATIMTPEQVLQRLKQAERLGCKEALFSLGEKPEMRYPQAANRLALLGYDRMTDYLKDMCELTLSETSLIPHINAGTLSEAEILKLRPVSGSMGMMLESVSNELMKKGGPHYKCPDKAPKRRLNTLKTMGEQKVPFTTGLLIGIGEAWEDILNALDLINASHKEFGNIQEVIIQNFRAKSGTAMAQAPEPSLRNMLATLAVTRIILDPSISLQAPPNLSSKYLRYLDAGINDLGGISPLTKDYINPERAWPELELLSDQLRRRGCVLHERLTVYPAYLKKREGFFSKQVAHRIEQLLSNNKQLTVKVA